MARLFFCVLFALSLAASACGGCGGNNGNAGEANVTIDTVDPVAGYPDVPITVSFTITPGEGTNEGGMEWEVRFGDGDSATGEGVMDSATHAYDLPGAYDIEVLAKFDGETVGSAVTSVRVYSEVDLVIDETRGSPANRRVGEDLQVSFTVTNNTAAEVFTPFEVAAYFSDSPTVSAEDIEGLVSLGTQEFVPDVEGEPVIASGGDRTAAFSVTVPDDLPSGDYYVVTVLDPRERIADTDRTSNIDVSGPIVRVENPEDALPDICISSLYVSPDRAFPQLNSVTRAVVACNEGGQDAFDVVLNTYLSIGDADFDPATDILLDTSDAFDIFSNDTHDIGPEQLVLDPGTEIVPQNGDVEVWVIVELSSSDPDADDTNNVLVSEFPILVTDEPVEGPDIVVRSFAVSPDSTFLNGTLNVTAEIANEGTVDVGSFFCGIYLGAGPRVDTNADPRLTNINVPSLDAGATIDINQPIQVPGLYPPGVYYFYMVCDPLNALQEPFRSNNAFIHPSAITVTDEADVDLFVESVSLPTSVNEGEMFDIVARFCVQGSNPSGDTRANLYSNPGNMVDYAADPLLEFAVPNVLPGPENCIDVTLQIEASCANFQSTYVFGVESDIDNRLPELNETNNRQAGSNTVTVNGEFCQCNEDAFEPNDTPLTAVPVLPGSNPAAICTPGNCDYWGVDLVAGDSLIVETQHDATKGNVTTTLYDPSGLSTIEVSSSPENQEVATFLVTTPGRYIVRVCGSTAQSRNIYDLDVQVLPQSAGIDVLPRDFELPFGDDFTIGETLDTSLRIYNLGAVASGAFDVEIYLSSNESTADDADNTLVASQQVANVSASGILDVDIDATLPTTVPDGDYWMFVVLDPQGAIADTDTSNNRLLSRRISVVTECYDPLEPNDSFGAARNITAGSYSNLQACAAQDDYYRLCLQTGKRFDVTVNFVDADGDIDLELRNEQSTVIDSSQNAQVDVEQVSWDFVNGDQCYVIRVYVIDNNMPDLQTTYSMDINVEDVDPSLLCSSAYEPNDSFNTASSFTAAVGATFNLDRCPASDTDFYFVNLAAGSPVSFTAALEPPAQPGTLRLQVYQPNQSVGPNVQTGPGVPTATISNYVPPTSGTYFIQITVSGATRNVTYKLSESGLGGVDLAPSSLSIGPGTYQPNDEVRFAFNLSNLRSANAATPPYEVFYSTSSTPTAQDISMGTFSAPTVNGNSVVAVNDRADLPATATAGARYIHVVVDGAGSTGDLNTANNTATVPITVVP